MSTDKSNTSSGVLVVENGRKPDTFVKPAPMPYIDGPEGLRYDFNRGLRMYFPDNGNKYHLKYSDADSGELLFNDDVAPGSVVSSIKKFYIKYHIVVTHQGADEVVFEHTYDDRGRDVLVQMEVGTLGDTIGWFSYVERLITERGCHVILTMTEWIAKIFEKQYPDITFIRHEDIAAYRPYATYQLGLFFGGDYNRQPIDFRYIGLHRTAAYILGVDPSDIPPRVDLSAPRKIKEPYVVIASHASGQTKYWNNPYGWEGVVAFLKDAGYRVLDIDKDRVHGSGIVWNHIPWGTEDFTGQKPLQERVDLIKDADFFIGLSSGLSWLAWCCDVPVVLISGFTHPTNEFATPYRVFNKHACNSCWNSMDTVFNHTDPLWCPFKSDPEQKFECTKLISVKNVTDIIETIPAFRQHQLKMECGR